MARVSLDERVLEAVFKITYETEDVGPPYHYLNRLMWDDMSIDEQESFGDQ